MKKTITKHDFRDMMIESGIDSFSYEGLGHMYDDLKVLEAGGPELEFDPVAFDII